MDIDVLTFNVGNATLSESALMNFVNHGRPGMSPAAPPSIPAGRHSPRRSPTGDGVEAEAEVGRES